MAKLEEIGIPGVNVGILHPAFAHRFRLEIGSSKLITMQVIKVKLNMRTSTMTVFIQQPVGHGTEMLEDIRSISFSETGFDRTTPFCLSLLDGSEGVHSKIEGFAQIADHEIVFDYADAAIATHKLTFKYKPAAK